MRKLTVFIEGDSKAAQLDERILLTDDSHCLLRQQPFTGTTIMCFQDTTTK